jgi:hypothetical protein
MMATTSDIQTVLGLQREVMPAASLPTAGKRKRNAAGRCAGAAQLTATFRNFTASLLSTMPPSRRRT